MLSASTTAGQVVQSSARRRARSHQRDGSRGQEGKMSGNIAVPCRLALLIAIGAAFAVVLASR